MLALNGIEKRFGALAALADLDLEVTAGEVLGIIGPNGSGKTTLLNTVTGVYPPSAGRVSFQGMDITGWKGHRIARLGVVRTFQNIRLFPTMTVFHNVWAAQHHTTGCPAGYSACCEAGRCARAATRKVWRRCWSKWGFSRIGRCWPSTCLSRHAGVSRSPARSPSMQGWCCSTSPQAG